MSWKKIGPPLLTAGCALLFTVLATWSLKSPGLQYDEAYFINAALGGITDAFVYRRVLGIPVMLMPYVGPLKSYVFAPIFALFGVSMATIRVPPVMVSAVCVVLGYKLARQLSGSRWIGVLLSLMMATDPIFVFLSRTDSGPIALMMFLKLAALIALFKLLETQESRFAWLLSISLILGLTDKLNFIWIVAALLLSAALVYRNEWRHLVRKRERSFVMAGGFLFLGLCAAGILILKVLLLTGRVAPVSWTARLDDAMLLYKSTMNAQIINQMMLGAAAMPSSPAYGVETVVLIGIVVMLVLSPAARRQRNLTFLIILFGLTLLQFVVTRQATGPHHVMTLWPFPHLILLLAGVAATGSLARQINLGQAAGSVLVGLAALVISLSQLNVTLAYNHAFDAALRLPPIWTRAIYPLTDYVSEAPDVSAVICIDWGICNQVLALSSPGLRSNNQDLWGVFANLAKTGEDQQTFDRFFKGRRAVVITHVGDAIVMPVACDNFTRFASRYLGNPAPSRVVADGEGRPVFAVYETGR